MTREEVITTLEDIIETYRDDEEYIDWVEACSYAINLIVKGDMYCPSCGVRLVSENEYVEPKPYKAESEVV